MPVYQAPRLNENMRHHLVFMLGGASSLLEQLLQTAQAEDLSRVTVVKHDNADALDLSSMKTDLQKRLAVAPIGTQVYLLGRQAQIWVLYEAAREVGMQPDEITVLRVEGSPRALYCVHCGVVQDISGESVVDCVGCGVILLVRQHFSSRLGAFMGVCADADHPYKRVAA
jgi:hypothetical protein